MSGVSEDRSPDILAISWKLAIQNGCDFASGGGGYTGADPSVNLLPTATAERDRPVPQSFHQASSASTNAWASA